MLTLHLGVIDVPYGKPPSKKKKGRKNKLKSSSALSTGDVADILEAKYHVMEIFYETKKTQIAKLLEVSIAESLENVLLGAPPGNNPFGSATDKIGHMFQKFLDDKEMERLGYPGVPTKAALKGVNHRLLHPFAKGNPERPSFIDTGQYQANTKAWIE